MHIVILVIIAFLNGVGHDPVTFVRAEPSAAVCKADVAELSPKIAGDPSVAAYVIQCGTIDVEATPGTPT